MESTFDSIREWDLYRARVQTESSCSNVELRLLHVNVRSLRRHWDGLLVLLSGRLASLDVLILSEISVDEKACSEFTLAGFNSYCLCREEKRGGGLLMFVKNDWFSDRINVSMVHAEVCAVSIHKSSSSYIVCAVYRPPHLNINMFCEEFSVLFRHFDNNHHILLAGDFNIDISDETKYGVSNYLDVLSSFGLENVILDYTREEYYGCKITKSCIDHIITRLGNVTLVPAVIKQKVADHYCIALAVLVENPANYTSNRTVLKAVLDDKKIDRQISAYDWNSLGMYDHITTYNLLVNRFKEIYKTSSTIKKIKKENQKICGLMMIF